MAEGELCFKNAFKKFLNKTNCSMESRKKELLLETDNDNEIKLKNPIEDVEKLQKSGNYFKEVFKLNCPDSNNMALSSNSENNLEKLSPQDCDKLLFENANIFRSLCVTEKDKSIRKENEKTRDFLSLSRVESKDLIINELETSEKLEFFDEVQTEYLNPKISKAEQFSLDLVSENIYINSSNKHICDAEVCDTSVQISSHYNDIFLSLKSTESPCLIPPTKILNKKAYWKLEYYRKLFIGNFDETIDTEELYYYFLQFGKIERTTNIRDHKARSKCIGYIIVFEKTDSLTTVQTSAPHVIHNKTLKLYLPKKDGCEPEEFCKLFIGNLHSRTTENDLSNYFQRWGKIVNCDVERKSETNVSKCRGSVTFKFFRAMNDALVYPYHQIKGRNLKVDLYHEGRQKFQSFDKSKYTYRTKHTPVMAKTSFRGAQKMDKKSAFSNNIPKKEFLTERKMLTIIGKSKIFKPMVLNVQLNDFDGAGVNIFNKPSLQNEIK